MLKALCCVGIDVDPRYRVTSIAVEAEWFPHGNNKSGTADAFSHLSLCIEISAFFCLYMLLNLKFGGLYDSQRF